MAALLLSSPTDGFTLACTLEFSGYGTCLRLQGREITIHLQYFLIFIITVLFRVISVKVTSCDLELEGYRKMSWPGVWMKGFNGTEWYPTSSETHMPAS